MALQFDINLTEIDDADTTTNWDGFRWTGTGQVRRSSSRLTS